MERPLVTDDQLSLTTEQELYGVLAGLHEVKRSLDKLGEQAGKLGIVGLRERIQGLQDHADLLALERAVSGALPGAAERREAMKAASRETIAAESRTVAELVQGCFQPFPL